MKKTKLKKTRKLLLAMALVTFLLTPLYSMMSDNGFIWEIDYDGCISCNLCAELAPNFISIDGDDDPFFTNGYITGGSSFYIQFSSVEDPDLDEAYNSCPSKDAAFKKQPF